jgi:hypothetical protein
MRTLVFAPCSLSTVIARFESLSAPQRPEEFSHLSGDDPACHGGYQH